MMRKACLESTGYHGNRHALTLPSPPAAAAAVVWCSSVKRALNQRQQAVLNVTLIVVVFWTCAAVQCAHRWRHDQLTYTIKYRRWLSYVWGYLIWPILSVIGIFMPFQNRLSNPDKSYIGVGFPIFFESSILPKATYVLPCSTRYA